jgi:hypothetical protein
VRFFKEYNRTKLLDTFYIRSDVNQEQLLIAFNGVARINYYFLDKSC